MSAAPGRRYASSQAILGDELFDKVLNARVLVVGAGGIGCELIKNMVMTGFGGGNHGQVELLDLDTIDLSNLNRQFLFQKQHVKRPKAVVARETALKFNPHVNITALHRNIKDNEFNVDYFKSFDFVMNALDNLDARRHVNKMCLAADIPLIESGTSGYMGQVQPIKRNTTECFDCEPKPVPKTFAVCTIRSTPSTAHHCIAWAKSYLFPQLFGAEEDSDSSELDEAEKAGENSDEIDNLRNEAKAISLLRQTLTTEGAANRVFDKVYRQDIERLLKMEDMWKHRAPPHALDFDRLQAEATKVGAEASTSEQAGIKDQRALSLTDSFELFISSVERLATRINPAEPLSFDKDDDDTLDFVVAAANLRASAFNIESQTRFQVKEYAGNIIPAIATTNAIIAGVLVLQALDVLRNDWTRTRSVWLSRANNRVLIPSAPNKPNPACSICRVVYIPLSVTNEYTLGQFVEEVVEGELGMDGHVIVQEGARVVFETEDLEDNKGKTLAELGIEEGKFVTVIDDDAEPAKFPISFSFATALPAGSAPGFKLLAPVPPIPDKELPPAPEPESDDELVAVSAAVTGEKAAKPTLVEGATQGEATKRKRAAEEAGLDPNGEGKRVKAGGEGEGEVITLD